MVMRNEGYTGHRMRGAGAGQTWRGGDEGAPTAPNEIVRDPKETGKDIYFNLVW
jgi:hypothetical protein